MRALSVGYSDGRIEKRDVVFVKDMHVIRNSARFTGGRGVDGHYLLCPKGRWAGESLRRKTATLTSGLKKGGRGVRER